MKQPFNVTGSLEIYKGNECFLDEKRIALLKLVRDKGSINSASKELKMSYQQAWYYIKAMNELSPLPVIVKQRGGQNGGGTIVTRYGERVINEFEAIKNQHNAINNEIQKSLWLCRF